MDTTAISQLIGQIGFPIVVALIVLLRMEPKMDAINNKLQQLIDLQNGKGTMVKVQ